MGLQVLTPPSPLRPRPYHRLHRRLHPAHRPLFLPTPLPHLSFTHHLHTVSGTPTRTTRPSTWPRSRDGSRRKVRSPLAPALPRPRPHPRLPAGPKTLTLHTCMHAACPPTASPTNPHPHLLSTFTLKTHLSPRPRPYPSRLRHLLALPTLCILHSIPPHLPPHALPTPPPPSPPPPHHSLLTWLEAPTYPLSPAPS